MHKMMEIVLVRTACFMRPRANTGGRSPGKWSRYFSFIFQGLSLQWAFQWVYQGDYHLNEHCLSGTEELNVMPKFEWSSCE